MIKMYVTFKAILENAMLNNIETVVLPDFGCRALGHLVHDVTDALYRVLYEYQDNLRP